MALYLPKDLDLRLVALGKIKKERKKDRWMDGWMDGWIDI
jgi:hypothetical protein